MGAVGRACSLGFRVYVLGVLGLRGLGVITPGAPCFGAVLGPYEADRLRVILSVCGV